ncbi:MAG: T9SS type A sorting domain-containing protein, partial [Flavobacteriales bacterium]|nr:T9SS type A sorting domain-containing protein [Flavobacteriales bacterium]
CSYYNVSSTSTDVLCNGGSDGSVSASVSGMDTSFTYSNTYSWTDASGSVVGTSSTVSGLAAGTYTCVVSDAINGCSASSSVVVGGPATAVTVTAVVVPSSSPISNNGSVDITVSGGTPCATSIQVGSGTTSSYISYLWYTWYMDGRTQMTYTASELAALGMTSGDIMDELAWNILSQTGAAATTIMNNAQMTVNGTVVYSGNYQAVLGMNNFVFSTPVVYTGGDLVVEWCFDNAAYVSGNNLFESTVTSGTMSQYADLSTSSGCGLTALLARTDRPNAYIGFQAASGYTFAWSTGDTTEDVSGLGMGPIDIIATDCNGCTGVWNGFIIAATNAGCIDPTASNYDPSANADCGSNPIVPGLYGDTSCCLYPGCIDSTASNYNPSANISDSSCIYPGCTSLTAINYNPQANLDDGSCLFYGCTDPTATNYNSIAVVGCDASGSTSCCTYSAGCGAITGVNMTDVIHDRVTFNWDDMNNTSCVVDQIRIRYREVGTNSYSTKTMGSPVGNNAPCLNTSKLILNLNASTQYEYNFKIWYQDGTNVTWHAAGTFTTLDVCDNVINITATPVNTTKTTFCWDSVTTYSFVRLQYRENIPGSSFSNIGGMGVISPTLCKDKNGLTPGTDYRVMWRTWCNPAGGPYRSAQWDGPVIWTQPTSIRVEGGTAINNLDVYPNPSRDIFNVTFTSEDVQDLDVRIINVIGEVVYTENLNEFVGEYTKQVDLATYTKGVYFLEITTDNGVINKKLILQ